MLWYLRGGLVPVKESNVAKKRVELHQDLYEEIARDAAAIHITPTAYIHSLLHRALEQDRAAEAIPARNRTISFRESPVPPHAMTTAEYAAWLPTQTEKE
jgi:hypothetical protein